MTRLSNRQFPLLRMFVERGLAHPMSIADAQQWDQRPFRSMLIQQWVEYRPGRGFHITAKGLAALQEFESTDIGRKDPSQPLTAYFDPTVYSLKKKLQLVRRKAA